MNPLTFDFLMKPPIDLEFKQFYYLSYINKVNSFYANKIFWPWLSSNIIFYNEAEQFVYNYKLFKSNLTTTELKIRDGVLYEQVNQPDDNEIVNDILKTINLILPHVKNSNELGLKLSKGSIIF